jgi:Ca2+-binding RTX toxin-like protein
MMSVTLDSHGTLQITGSNHADVINVVKRFVPFSENSPALLIEVNENGTWHSFDASKVKRIRATLGDGNDLFAASGAVRTRMTVDGGNGDDDIRGGIGNDVLRGGAGDDKINGQRGSDTLVGGAGSDTIEASQSPDVRNGTMFIAAPPRGIDQQPDVIDVAGDGAADRVRCNANDTVHADPIDRVVKIKTELAALGTIGLGHSRFGEF